jgi:ribosomal protein L12E/L44/L45/RPP1/RPP2
MPTSAYHALKHAKRGPSADRIAALARAIGCTADDIVSAWAA